MKTLVANWKMNPQFPHEADELFEHVARKASLHPSVQTVVCPPFVFLERLSAFIKGKGHDVLLGAQDVFWEASGAHTGEISVPMLRAFGVRAVLVGHSERRALGETDEQINKKLRAVLAANMTPVLLIGELEKNDAVRQDILIDQLTRDLEGISPEDSLKIRYTFEPAWAISTTSGNKAESLDSIITGVRMMRDILSKMFFHDQSSFTMFYGASVNGSNCEEILARPEIAGAVVGGASLRADEFGRMIEIVAKL